MDDRQGQKRQLEIKSILFKKGMNISSGLLYFGIEGFKNQR